MDQLQSYHRNHQASQVALAVKNLSAHAGRPKRREFNTWVRKTPGAGHSNPCQYSCLEFTMDRGAWQAAVPRVAQSQTRLKRQHTHARTHREPSQRDPLTFPESQFDLKSVPVSRICVLYICSTRKHDSCSSCESIHIQSLTPQCLSYKVLWKQSLNS